MAKNAADLTAGARKNGNHKNGTAKPGLRFGRYFTPEASHAYDLIEWERRTAAITGAFVAVTDAIARLVKTGALPGSPIRDCVAAISVGMVGNRPVLDLNYVEDSTAEVDMNVVMTGAGAFVEVQGTAEQTPFSKARLDELLVLAGDGIARLVGLQRRALEARGDKRFTL